MLMIFFLSQVVFGAFRSSRIHPCDEVPAISTTEGSSAREEVCAFDSKEETKRYWSHLLPAQHAKIISTTINLFQKEVENSFNNSNKYKETLRKIIEELEAEGYASLRYRFIHLKGAWERDNISAVF